MKGSTASTFAGMLRLFLRKSWLRLSMGVFSGLIAGLSSAGLIAIINSNLHDPLPTGGADSWSFILLCLLMLVFGGISDFTLSSLAEDQVFDLRLDISKRIMSTPFRELQELGRHRCMASLTEDVGAVSVAYQSLFSACSEGSVAVGVLVYLGWLSWPKLLLLMVFIAFGMSGYKFLEARAWKAFAAARDDSDRLFKLFRALVEGAKELRVQAYRRDALTDDLKRTAHRIRLANLTGMTAFVVATHWSNLLYYVMIGIVLFALTGVNSGPDPVVTGYVLGILYLIGPFAGVVHAMPGISRGIIAWGKIERLGAALREVSSEMSQRSDDGHVRQFNALRVENMEYAYGGGSERTAFSLGPLTLNFCPGELVFLVGGNGSGKTTLAMLLVGLYVPQKGCVYFNGRAVTEANRAEYRQNFSIVFSDSYIFETLPVASMHGDRIVDLLVQLQLEGIVSVEDGQFSTVKLSKGQRKRLALLCAVLEDRPIYVFDEWAADQDPEFRAVFYNVILPELRGQNKLVIVISHDDRYYHLADRCMGLDYGQLIEAKAIREELTAN